MRTKVAVFSLFSVVVLICLVITGCGKEVETSKDFIPHADGYTWEYRCSLYEGTLETSALKRIRYFDGTTTLSNGLTVQNFITSEEVISSLNAKALGITDAFGVPLPYAFTYCYIDDTGVYNYGTPGNPTTEAELFLPLPLVVGKAWGRGDVTCEVVGAEVITVSAGTFNALKVSLSQSPTLEPIMHEWYADGVGMVKSLVEDIILVSPTGEVTGTGSFIVQLVNKNF